MQFGNWFVTKEKIEFHHDGAETFVIPAEQLLDVDSVMGQDYYRWILMATNEDWLSEDDLVDLNYAFVYAAAKSTSDFDYAIFDNTLTHQYNQLDDEDENSCLN